MRLEHVRLHLYPMKSVCMCVCERDKEREREREREVVYYIPVQKVKDEVSRENHFEVMV